MDRPEHISFCEELDFEGCHFHNPVPQQECNTLDELLTLVRLKSLSSEPKEYEKTFTINNIIYSLHSSKYALTLKKGNSSS